MNEITRRLLLSFEWRPVFILVLLLLAFFYTRGWFRLRQKSRNKSIVPVWKLVGYLFALLTLGLALMSFIDILGASLFYFHMIQHLMLTMIAGPLVMLADPMPITLWGMPDQIRRAVGQGLSRLLHRNSPYRNILKQVTSPAVSYILILVLLWG